MTRPSGRDKAHPPPASTASSQSAAAVRASPSDVAGLSVLFVTDRSDAPYRYRCVHPCLQLRAEGVRCDILHVQDRRLLGSVQRFSVIVLFRLPWSDHVSALVDEACARGAALVFDMDDLVFDPALCAALPFLANAPTILRLQYEHQALRLKRTFDACEAFVGPTPTVTRVAEAAGKRAFVHPNLLHPGLVRASRRVHALRSRMQRRPIIAYMSGSMTHNEDFARVVDVLLEIMERRRDVSLMIGGFLDHPAAEGGGAIPPDRVIRIPFQDWRVQPWSMNLARVNLAPIAVIDDFTNSKSALKFFEAAVIGLPTIATPTEPFRQAISHGVDGYLAEDPDAWREAILSCLDPAAARRIGETARETALREHTHTGHRHRLRDFFATLGGRAAASYGKPLPIPAGNPDPGCAPSWVRRGLSRASRARAVIGILRRTRRPASLSRPDLCRTDHVRHEITRVDEPVEPFDAARAAAPPRERSLVRGSRLIAMQLFATPQPFGPWCAVGGTNGPGRGGAPDWMSCGHGLPGLLSPVLQLEPGPFAALFVSLAAETRSGEACGRFAWRTSKTGKFSDHKCVYFPLICDGRLHRYLVSLAETNWPDDATAIRALRLDPLNVPGDFHLDCAALLTDAAGPEAS